MLFAVPRLLNRMADNVRNTIGGMKGFKKKIADKALATKIKNVKKGKLTHCFYDMAVFSKVKKR
jgi:long-subunit acyl-CoA synthetase (AMP-forming)